MKTIKLNKKDLEKAKQFTGLRMEDVDLYIKRGGVKELDLITGALGEIAVYKLLKDSGINVSPPDFEIYEAKQKSYDSDLTDGTLHFHVKSQNMVSSKRYGRSWLFQRYDKLVNKPERRHYIVPCEVDIEKLEVRIFGIFSPMTITKRGLWGECKHPAFRATKLALYYDNIKEIGGKWRILKTS